MKKRFLSVLLVSAMGVAANRQRRHRRLRQQHRRRQRQQAKRQRQKRRQPTQEIKSLSPWAMHRLALSPTGELQTQNLSNPHLQKKTAISLSLMMHSRNRKTRLRQSVLSSSRMLTTLQQLLQQRRDGRPFLKKQKKQESRLFFPTV